MSTPPPAGADLARIAVVAAREAAKQRGIHSAAQRKPKRRPAGSYRSGRDPLALEGALAALITERGWETPAAGGSILDRWVTIATPEVAAHLQAVSFDERTGTLDILASSAAWATQGRLISTQLMRQANEATGRQTVRRIVIKAPGSRTPQAAASAPAPAAGHRSPPNSNNPRSDPPVGYQQARSAVHRDPRARDDRPFRTREMAHPGYHQVLALVHRSTSADPPSPASPPPAPAPSDGTSAYRAALARLGSPAPAIPPTPPAPITRAVPPAGYLQALRSLRAGKVLSIPPPGPNDASHHA